MKIILESSNKHKAEEINKILKERRTIKKGEFLLLIKTYY
jgi:inosine/xanthosine triphosphate pyrophosphatase family protein